MPMPAPRAPKSAAALAEHKQRLISAGKRALVVGATHLDLADGSVRAMHKPGAAEVALASHIQGGRSSEKFGRQAPRASQIGPRRRARTQAWPFGPTHLEWPVGSPALPRPNCRRMCRRNADETPQDLTHLAEVQAAVEVLDEVEDVALRLAERVPPTAPVMGDDQYLVLATALFQGVMRAFADIRYPANDHALQNDGTVHTAPEPLELDIVGHDAVRPGLLWAAGCAIAPFRTSSPREPDDREAGCKGAASAGGGRAAASLAA